MADPQLSYPLINGVRYDFSAIALSATNIAPTAGIVSAASDGAVPTGPTFTGLKSISYSEGLKPSKVHGTSPYPIGRTRGTYEADGSIEIYRSEFDNFKGILELIGGGLGYLEVTFDLTVNYAYGALPLTTDTVVGCRIMKSSNSGTSGSADALTIKLDLDVMYIKHNGNPGISGIPGAPIVASI